MKKVQKTPEEIAEELAKGRLQPFDAWGKHWQGDIFYSDINRVTRNQGYDAFSKVCDILREKGYYVHS